MNMFRFYSNPNGRQRITVVGTYDEQTETLSVGVSKNSKKDPFIRKKGRAIAESRALSDKGNFGKVKFPKEDMNIGNFLEIASVAVDLLENSNTTINNEQFQTKMNRSYSLEVV